MTQWLAACIILLYQWAPGVIIDALYQFISDLMIADVVCIHGSGVFDLLLITDRDLPSVIFKALLIGSHITLHKYLRMRLVHC